MRLIDADALMKEFAEFVKNSNNSDFAEVPTWNDAVSLLGSAPTIEPERKNGKWTGDNACPFCGFHLWLLSFCPNCGADMREGETDAVD